MAPDDDETFDRAMRSARRRAALDGATAMQPARGSCGFERTRGELHYVLRNVSGELARFRVTDSGRLMWIEVNRKVSEWRRRMSNVRTAGASKRSEREYKITQEQHEQIVALVREGNYPDIAAEATGVSAKTLRAMLNHGKGFPDSRCADLLRELVAAENKFFELTKAAKLAARARGDRSAAAAAQWLLDRRRRVLTNDKTRRARGA